MKFLSSIRSRCGDFWWYAALIFIASRFGDFINLYIGLWLVPRFVPDEDLGAVVPLSAFATTLALPVSIFGFVFMKQVNVLTAENRRGQLKTLLRSVFVVTAVLLVVKVVVDRVSMSHVFERIRIAKGSLGILVVATGFLGTVSPVYTNALQAMKRFKSLSLMHVLGAPIRLVVMLIAMPVRAIAGYFTAQASVSLWQVLLSVFSLKRELGNDVPAEPYWSRVRVRSMLRYAFFVMLYYSCSFASFVEALVIRQRLSPVDSAAYYMISRFGEVGVYAGAALLTVLFPYVSEAAAAGDRKADRIIYRSTFVSIGFGFACAAGFYFCGGWLLSLFPNGDVYARYSPQMALLTLSLTLWTAVNCAAVGALAAERFRFLWWWVPLHVVYGGLLLCITGYGYFEPFLPERVVLALKAINEYGLNFVLIAMLGAQIVKLALVLLPFNRKAPVA